MAKKPSFGRKRKAPKSSKQSKDTRRQYSEAYRAGQHPRQLGTDFRFGASGGS